jgi:hypothetical protein
VDIELVIDDTKLRGTLDDTAAGRDFASLLPLTLTLTDFHATEKISDLARRLSTKGGLTGPPRRPVTSPTTHRGATSPSSTATSPTPKAWYGWAASTPKQPTSSPAWTTAPPSPSTPPADQQTRPAELGTRFATNTWRTL